MSYKALTEEDFEDDLQGPDPTTPSLQEEPPSIDSTNEKSHDAEPVLDAEKHISEKDKPHETLANSTVGFIPGKVGRKTGYVYTFARRTLGIGGFVMLFGFLAAAITLIALSPSCSKESEGEDLLWWQTTVIYQCYPRSFQDTTHNGSGDIRGIESRVDHFVNIGVKAVWLNPIFTSPQRDNGYDIVNYTNVDPLYGTLDDLKSLLQALRAKGIHLLLDFVPNHTSDEHPWFKESRSSKTNPKRDWYVWADPNEFGGPPSNWISVFGGSAWSYCNITDQYYLHQFSSFQPDLNYRNPDVVKEMQNVLKFWLDFGVDGFRVDAVPFLLEDPKFRNESRNPDFTGNCTMNISSPDCFGSLIHNLTQNYPGIHNIVRSWRSVLDSFSTPSHERFMVGEVYASLDTVMEYYGSDKEPEFDFPFNFFLLGNQHWTGNNVSALVASWMDNMPSGRWPNWVLGNHDNPRIASKAGVYLARALNILLMTLPGTPTTYYGEEILMTDVYVPPDKRQDKFQHRDPERTGMQWNTSKNAGFTTATPWINVTATNYTTYNVKTESADNTSMLSLYTKLVDLRSNHTALQYTGYKLVNSTVNIYAYRRYHESSKEEFLIVVNFATVPKEAQLRNAEISDPEIVLSSNLNRTGPVDLKAIELLAGEAIIIQGTRQEDTCS